MDISTGNSSFFLRGEKLRQAGVIARHEGSIVGGSIRARRFLSCRSISKAPPVTTRSPISSPALSVSRAAGRTAFWRSINGGAGRFATVAAIVGVAGPADEQEALVDSGNLVIQGLS